MMALRGRPPAGFQIISAFTWSGVFSQRGPSMAVCLEKKCGLEAWIWTPLNYQFFYINQGC